MILCPVTRILSVIVNILQLKKPLLYKAFLYSLFNLKNVFFNLVTVNVTVIKSVFPLETQIEIAAS